MRILHATDASSSGVLTAMTTLARAQAAVPGIEVEVVYTPRKDSPPPAEISRLAAGAAVRRLTARPRAAVPVLAAQLPWIIGRGRFDVIHVHSSRAGMLGRIAAAATGHRGQVVYSPHSFAFDRTDASPRTAGILRGLERLGGLLGPRLLLCSPSEEELARRVLPGARTAVLPNAVDTRALAAARRDQDPEEPLRPLRVVHVGRIAAQKRPDVFGAIAEDTPVAAGDRTFEFRWLGDGDRSLLPRSVHVTGWLTAPRLHEELSRADILLFTSAGEGMPISALEAQALSVPVVGHDVTGLRDVVVDGRTGILATDDTSLRAALQRLLDDTELRREQSQAAAVHARATFDVADLARRSLDGYRRLGMSAPPEGAITR